MRTMELRSKQNTVIQLPFVPLAKCLELFARNSCGFAELLRTTIAQSSNCSLTLVLYNDGVVPGSVLSPDPQRKSILWYGSFLEFGNLIRSEYVWFPLALVRESVIAQISDGLPAYFRSLLKTMLPPESSLTKEGEPLVIERQTWLLRLKGFRFVADEGAIKASFNHKGASGLRPCIKCKNAVTNLNLADEYFVHISEHNFNRFDPQSDADMFEVADAIKASVLGGVRNVGKLQMFSGLNYTEQSILFDPEVRIYMAPSNICYDPMHIFFSSGILGLEITLLFEAINEAHENGQIPFCSDDLAAVVTARWLCATSRPRHSSPAERGRAFKLALRDKCNASGLLGLFPLLDFAVRTLLSDQDCLRKEVQSFLALCATVRLVCRSKANADARTSLQLKQSSHMNLFSVAYGEATCKPKHHWQFHIQDQMASATMLLDCFVCERKHRLFKTICLNVNTSSSFERVVLARLLTAQREQMASLSFKNVMTNDTFSHQGLSWHRNDCVIWGCGTCLVIKGFKTMDDSTVAVGNAWQLVS